MKTMKKVLAMLLAVIMTLGMTVTTFAATPAKSDTATVKITGISGTPNVTLYQIAKGEYGPGDAELTGFTWATGATFKNELEPTAAEITKIANGLVKGDITPQSTTNDKVTGTTYEKTVSAGAYIAVITGATDGEVYNPVLLTASYNENGVLDIDEVNVADAYLYGTTAVAKKTTPSIDKTVAGTTADGDKKTASVGDVLTYTITPTMPSYPVDALNKTFFVADTMSTGLTFDYSTLKVTINGTDLIKDGDNFKSGNDVVAKAASTTNGFNLWFDYDKLISDVTTGAVDTPIISYQAVVNKDAVAGGTGNVNDAELYYSNKPNEGSTWMPETPDDRPDASDGVTKKEDSETVYTYQLSFLKIGEDDEAEGLENAVFGIYTDADCTKLIDKVTTNANGYAVSTNVAAGTYYVKEISAPTGYTLNTNVYTITANWTTATTKDTATVTDCTYTTEAPSDDAVQVGWIKNGTFYAMDEYTEATDDVKPAYISSTSTTTTSSSTITKNETAGGTVSLETKIPNTKLVNLPSTGGIGTTIFTIAGCAIMIAAAFLFIMSRRKESK